MIAVIEYRNELIKMHSNKYKMVINISDNVISNLKLYLQNKPFINESGGVLIGYKVRGYNEIIIEDISLTDEKDESSIIKFVRKSISHILKIKKASLNNSFCIGNWHTHPVAIPCPSPIDLSTWKEELSECKSSFGFQVYIICGIDGFKVWLGEEKAANIVECFECEKNEGIYIDSFNENAL